MSCDPSANHLRQTKKNVLVQLSSFSNNQYCEKANTSGCLRKFISIRSRQAPMLRIEEWRDRWAFCRGATKADKGRGQQHVEELRDALAEVDGLLAGMNYLDRVEPDDYEESFLKASSTSPSPSTEINPMPPKSSPNCWTHILDFNLPQIHPSISAEQRKQIETSHLKKAFAGKLARYPNQSPVPSDQQWATLRSLRKASIYHYRQFLKLTRTSSMDEIKKLRKSYGTAKCLLDMGILSFRDLLHGKKPTTLKEVFAFASLSYVISKSLHAKGYIDESKILSGILVWRNAIADKAEQLALERIAQLLWPEAQEILHFIPIHQTPIDPRNIADTAILFPVDATQISSNIESISCTAGATLEGEPVLDGGFQDSEIHTLSTMKRTLSLYLIWIHYRI